MSPRISIRLLAAQPDQRLAALAGEGHERAFEALVQRYRRPLLRYCRGMRVTDTRAEDILQQAFLQAWMAFAGGTEVRDVRPWLYRIVHNATVNAMRGAAEAHGELSEAAQATAALATESHLQRRMALHDALSDVAALPPMQQQAIFLTAVDGQSHDEVAGVLGISEGALRGLLYRARSTLRSAAAALTPPPILAWASAGAGSGGPTAERLAELSAGGGAAGMAGLLFKGAVVAVTAGALAGGASVLSVHHRGARTHAAHTHAARGTSAGAALSAGSFALASDSQIARVLANLHRPAAQDGRSRAGRHGRQGSSRESHRHGGGADERHGGEPAQRGGDDLLVADDGGRRLSSGSPGRGDSGSPDLGSGAGGRNSSGGDTRSGGGQGSGGNGSGQGGSGHDGSGQGGSGGSGASLADSPADSPGAPAADQTSGTQQSPVVGADELATASGGRQSSTGGGDS